MTTADPGTEVLNDCAGSSKTWAQAYQYALRLMEGDGVAIGTDMNGMAGAAGPRFGKNAAYAVVGDKARERLRIMNCAAKRFRWGTIRHCGTR